MFSSISLAIFLSTTLVSSQSISCGVNGYDKGVSAYYSSTKSSIATYAGCSGQCQNDASCKSFAVGSSTCLLYSTSVASNVNKITSSPYVFYDKACISASSSSTSAKQSIAATSTASSTLVKVTSSSSISVPQTKSTTSVFSSQATVLSTSSAPPTTKSSSGPQVPSTSSRQQSSSSSVQLSPSTSLQQSSSVLVQQASSTSSAPTTSLSAPAVCGSPGYDSGTPQAFFYDDTLANSNFTSCSAICLANSACRSFAAGGACLLYAAPVTGNFVAVAGSPYSFYDRSCIPVPSSSSAIVSSTSLLPATSTSSTASASSSACSPYFLSRGGTDSPPAANTIVTIEVDTAEECYTQGCLPHSDCLSFVFYTGYMSTCWASNVTVNNLPYSQRTAAAFYGAYARQNCTTSS
ncbi:hypothetical protein BT63DRAFT_422999 [Microthyrium microscopicum]|uniref:Apple domain-containing protein n=1 Tax=Microthyrium microscopicum TaxID=703497 RepID=A0A6A6UGB0_9PEZI|nr:hypothetical protein BT63DRAFT_422999 [Microthyrium microscopicum]